MGGLKILYSSILFDILKFSNTIFHWNPSITDKGLTIDRAFFIVDIGYNETHGRLFDMWHLTTVMMSWPLCDHSMRQLLSFWAHTFWIYCFCFGFKSSTDLSINPSVMFLEIWVLLYLYLLCMVTNLTPSNTQTFQQGLIQDQNINKQEIGDN